MYPVVGVSRRLCNFAPLRKSDLKLRRPARCRTQPIVSGLWKVTIEAGKYWAG